MSLIESILVGVGGVLVLIFGVVGFVAGPALLAALTEKPKWVQVVACCWFFVAIGILSGVYIYFEEQAAPWR